MIRQRLTALLPAVLIALACGLASALAVGNVTVPPARSLGATALYDETQNPPTPLGVAGNPVHTQQDSPSPAGNNGTDRSVNAPSLSGLTLLETINAYPARIKFEVMVSCTAGAKIVLDDQAGTLTPTIFPISGGASDGAQGTVYVNATHAGRVRIYSSNPACQVTGREH